MVKVSDAHACNTTSLDQLSLTAGNPPLSLQGVDFAEGYIAVIDKPYEWTSTDVVRKIKYKLRNLGYKKIKIGHAGTLDPLATGILLVCIGRATKMVDSLQAEQKEYVTDMELGATTPSFDMEHPVDERYEYEHITSEMVASVCASLEGERLQTPPLYSAKKVEGVRAYESARAGEQVELRQALVNIYGIEVLAFDNPHLRLRVECSRGTYIRSLAREVGEGLGSGAYLRTLCRTRSGGFTLENSYSLDYFLKKLDECETK